MNAKSAEYSVTTSARDILVLHRRSDNEKSVDGKLDMANIKHRIHLHFPGPKLYDFQTLFYIATLNS